MSIPSISQTAVDFEAFRAWIHGPESPHIHRLAYIGGDQTLKQQIDLLHGAEIYRNFVNRVTGRTVADPTIPLVINGGAQGSPRRLSQIVPFRWEELTAVAGPQQVSPMQLAVMRGHTRVVELLREAERLRRSLEGQPVTPPVTPSHPSSLGKNEAAATWAAEIVARKGSATHLSQFTSSLDRFIRGRLGEELFQTNVAKVILGNRRYIFIADRHLNQTMHTLKGLLIAEINRTHATKPVAFFMESVHRDPEIESRMYRDWLGRAKPEGLLYGPEPEFFRITSWLLARNNLIMEQKVDALLVLYEMTVNPASRQALNALKQRNNGPKIDQMIASLETCSRITREGEPRKAAILFKAQPLFDNVALLAELYLKLAQAGMDLGWMPQEGVKPTLDVLRRPEEDKVFAHFFDAVNINLRDSYMARNILSVVRTLPADVEVAIYMGFLHMPGLVRELQRGE